MTIGACGMYIVPVVLPAVQAEFGIPRADATLPYSLLMISFGVGGLLMGRLADRHGIMIPLLIAGAALGLGFGLAATTTSLLPQPTTEHGPPVDQSCAASAPACCLARGASL